MRSNTNSGYKRITTQVQWYSYPATLKAMYSLQLLLLCAALPCFLTVSSIICFKQPHTNRNKWTARKTEKKLTKYLQMWQRKFFFPWREEFKPIKRKWKRHRISSFLKFVKTYICASFTLIFPSNYYYFICILFINYYRLMLIPSRY